MRQPEAVGPVEKSVGYMIKQASVALRGALDEALRPMGLTVSQYSCLEVLGQRPGISNAELARATFVTRQSMNAVLHGLEARGLVIRPATATRGRELPAELAEGGREQLREASVAVRAVEKRMCSGLDDAEQRALLAALTTCVRSLADPR